MADKMTLKEAIPLVRGYCHLHPKGILIRNAWEVIDAHIAAANDRLKAAERDSKRLDWLALHPRGAQVVVDGEAKDCIFWGISSAPENTLRGAIDSVTQGAGDE